MLTQRLQDRHPDPRLDALIAECAQVAATRGVELPPAAAQGVRERAGWLPLPGDARVVLHTFLSLSCLATEVRVIVFAYQTK